MYIYTHSLESFISFFSEWLVGDICNRFQNGSLSLLMHLCSRVANLVVIVDILFSICIFKYFMEISQVHKDIYILIHSLEHFKSKIKKIGGKLKTHYNGIVVLWYKDKMEYYPAVKWMSYIHSADMKVSPFLLYCLLFPRLCLWPHGDFPTISWQRKRNRRPDL